MANQVTDLYTCPSFKKLFDRRSTDTIESLDGESGVLATILTQVYVVLPSEQNPDFMGMDGIMNALKGSVSR